MKKYLFIISLCLVALTSCNKKSERMLTSATGSIYELLVVVDNQYWESHVGDTLRELFEAPVPALPQVEPYFNLSHAPLAAFDNMLMPSRNILLIDVNGEKYTQTKIGYSTDRWSHPQAVVRICCPNKEELVKCLDEYGLKVRKYFVDEELHRQGDFYKSYCNHDAAQDIMRKFGVMVQIPNDMVKIESDRDFYWVCDARGQARKDIVIYSYPYTDKNTFTPEFLIHKRDSVMAQHVKGSIEGSYMITEMKHIPPVFNEIYVNDNGYCAELRGLWKMQDGLSMGGPFVSHSRVDELNRKVITIECFVYAAGMKKRNTLRQLEAVLYTMKLPQEINAIPTLDVRPDSPIL